MKGQILDPSALIVNLFFASNGMEGRTQEAFYINKQKGYEFIYDNKLKYLLYGDTSEFPVIYIHNSLTILKYND